MNIAFRVDASLQIGSGHVMRCLTLAHALYGRGFNIHFLCREHPGHLIGLIRSKGYEVHILPTDADVVDVKGTAHAGWLGTSQDVDARFSVQILAHLQPVWLIVDHYALDYVWENQVQEFCQYSMVIDDLADRKHVCHMLVDQNWHGTSGKSRYKCLVDHGVKQLLGPQYALLAPEYREERLKLKERSGVVRQILVFMGGTDPDDTIKLILKDLFLLDLADIKIKVVTGINYPYYEKLAADFSAMDNLEIMQSMPTLATLMRESDLMIGAGGSTNWERMCMGLPSVILSVADNQVKICELLSQDGYITYLGKSDEVDSGVISNAVSCLINRSDFLREQSIKMMTMVDGLGVERVFAEIFGGDRNGIASLN